MRLGCSIVIACVSSRKNEKVTVWGESMPEKQGQMERAFLMITWRTRKERGVRYTAEWNATVTKAQEFWPGKDS